ncbi:nucleotidyltransferase domain-containing protein [Mesorhizobium sp. M0664]|uniref:GSU2403 family nucleotidyltransferase fold protein n=1 Tax=Mesorhizobium sp. M0664 TaxID=2956982 RepID=UPI00333DEBDC
MARSVEHVFKDHLRLRAAGDLEQNLRRNYADVVLLAANPNLVGHDAERVSPNTCAANCPKVSSTTSQNRSAVLHTADLVWHDWKMPMLPKQSPSMKKADRYGSCFPIRVFLLLTFRVSKRADRQPVKRGRDLAQAQAIVRLTTQYLEHLTYEASELRALPMAVFDEAHHYSCSQRRGRECLSYKSAGWIGPQLPTHPRRASQQRQIGRTKDASLLCFGPIDMTPLDAGPADRAETNWALLQVRAGDSR